MFRSLVRQFEGKKPRWNTYRPFVEPLEMRLVPTLNVPVYNSLLGAKATLYLNFVGDFTASWGSYSNITTPAYDIDSDPTTFSATELSNIQQIWQRVAERYAPFNINVTTVDPGSYPDGVALKVDIGGDCGWTGVLCGGISYVGSFTSPYSPNISFVFPAELGNGTPSYVGDAASHEAGHAFGLQHQAQWSGSTLTTDYYAGPGDGTAPIMGYSYNATRSLWWYGTSDVSPTSYQDDMAVIASSVNGFGYRTNTWSGTSTTTAAALGVDSSGNVSGSGVIEKMSDLDYFTFNTGAGNISLTVSVPSGYNTLDAKLELLDANGNVVATADPSDSFNATINYTASAGTYYLVVASHGTSANATGTNYGQDVGSYTLGGTIIPTGVSAPAAPSNLTASAASTSQINLSWTDNSNNEDGFKIERLNSDGTWSQVATVGANVTTWSDTGLTAGTTYTYRVRAYNASGGDSAYSNTASTTTNTGATVPAAPSGLAAAVKSKPSLRVNLTWLDNSTNETGFKIERSTDGGVTWSLLATVGANVTSYSDTNVTKGGSYTYRVYAYDGVGSSGYSNVVSITVGSASAGHGSHGSAFLTQAIDPASDNQLTWFSATTLNGASVSNSGGASQGPAAEAVQAVTTQLGGPAGSYILGLAGSHHGSDSSAAGLFFGNFDTLPDFNEAVVL
jgi:hypothetical protein